MLDNVNWILGVSGMSERDNGSVDGGRTCRALKVANRGGYERNMHKLHLDLS